MTGWRAYLQLSDAELLAQCEFDRFRASGPGGQKRNRTDSAVRLRHRPTGLQSEAVESRSQHENRARALRRLRLTIAIALRAPKADATAGEQRVLRSLTADPPSRLRPVDFSSVALLFDVLDEHAWRISDAADALELSTAAVGRFLQVDPRVWRAAAERRLALGLSPLRAGR
ncbi:MAG: peptide chain release factor-like protein [Dehalococcoidia bacterium]|nr:peptide chain release factor-like protein [Dehalococcoidia bacterium]HRC61837.1 peptide chain release factor-like protein [Dehalococcoidia bacterium]